MSLKLSKDELELLTMAEKLKKALRNPVHDTRRYSDIYNISYDIYRKSVSMEVALDPDLIQFED